MTSSTQLNTAQAVSFAGWLAKHAGLIRKLVVYYKGVYVLRGADTVTLTAALKQLVEFALQGAASAAASRSGAPLTLYSYTSFVPPTAGLLAALPAATLTSLNLRLDSSNSIADISRLSNLQRLSLNLFYVQAETHNNCLREIGKLEQLRQLQLIEIAAESDMQLLPAQLQHLQLEYSGWDDDDMVGVRVNLQHMTSLRVLELKAGDLTAGSSVPVNLQSLELHAQWPVGGLAGFDSLHQVTAMELSCSSMSREHLEGLRHLRQLKSLSLSLRHHEDPLEVAAAWHGLPLHALHIKAAAVAGTELRQLMQHVATATMLTELDFRIDHIGGAVGPDGGKLAICQQLQMLKHLSCLTFNVGDFPDFEQHDTQHLSALVTLTSLELGCYGYGPCIDEATLCFLAVTLTGLKSLAINVDGDQFDQELQILHVLPAIGRLTDLEVLRLQCLRAEDALRGLQFLTDLSRLTMLEGFRYAREAALRQFNAAIE